MIPKAPRRFSLKSRIIRERHPLQGKILEVLGWSHRNDSLHLTPVLPDGTDHLIPPNGLISGYTRHLKPPIRKQTTESHRQSLPQNFIHLAATMDDSKYRVLS
jgi:hypothetical protein